MMVAQGSTSYNKTSPLAPCAQRSEAINLLYHLDRMEYEKARQQERLAQSYYGPFDALLNPHPIAGLAALFWLIVFVIYSVATSSPDLAFTVGGKF